MRADYGLSVQLGSIRLRCGESCEIYVLDSAKVDRKKSKVRCNIIGKIMILVQNSSICIRSRYFYGLQITQRDTRPSGVHHSKHRLDYV